MTTWLWSGAMAKRILEELPALQNELAMLQSETFLKYQERLDIATTKALDALTTLLDDGTLLLDPESLVQAVKTMTTAKKDLAETKRKLIETTIRGQIMLTALDDKDPVKRESILDTYIATKSSTPRLEDSQGNSMFPPIEADDTETDSEPS